MQVSDGSTFIGDDGSSGGATTNVIVTQASTLDVESNAGSVSNWFVGSGANVTATLNSTKSADYIRVDVPITFALDPTLNYANRTVEHGYSNFEHTASITSVSTIALRPETGIYRLTSSNATETLATLTTPSSYFPYRLYPESGLTLTASHGTSTNQPRCKGASSAVLNGSNGDWVEFDASSGQSFETNRANY